MKKEQVFEMLTFEGTAKMVINGVAIPFETIKETFENKVWKSALVIKNRRETETGGLKNTIGQALALKLVSTDKALQIILTNDKESAKELFDKLPKVDKADEPNETDVEQAIALVLAGGGQNVSI